MNHTHGAFSMRVELSLADAEDRSWLPMTGARNRPVRIAAGAESVAHRILLGRQTAQRCQPYHRPVERTCCCASQRVPSVGAKEPRSTIAFANRADLANREIGLDGREIGLSFFGKPVG